MHQKGDKKFFAFAQILIGIFFLMFVFFSYFLLREGVIFSTISREEYTLKYYENDLKMCNSLKSQVYYDTATERSVKLRDSQMCREELYEKSQQAKWIDFKYALIKYGLAVGFSLVLFLSFLISTLFYGKKYFQK